MWARVGRSIEVAGTTTSILGCNSLSFLSLRGRLYGGIVRRPRSTWARPTLLPLLLASTPLCFLFLFLFLFLPTSQNVIVLTERGLGHTLDFFLDPSAPFNIVEGFCVLLPLSAEPFMGGSLSVSRSVSSRWDMKMGRGKILGGCFGGETLGGCPCLGGNPPTGLDLPILAFLRLPAKCKSV